MRKAIITGGTGYIGSNLCKRLVNDGWDVCIIARETSDFTNLNQFMGKVRIFIYDGHIDNLVDFFKKEKADVVFHLASLVIIEHTSKEIDPLIDSIIRFGVQVLEAMKQSDTKVIINTGTYWQHYNSNDYNPVNLYAASKEAFTAFLRYYTDAEKIRSITLMLFDTYGENDTRPKLINLLNKSTEDSQALRMSEGEQYIDLVYIDDVIDAYIQAFTYINDNECVKYEEFGVSSGHEINLKELVSTFEKVSNKRVNVIWGARPYRKREVMYVWSDYKTLPGWTCKISLEEGLARYKQGV